MESTKITVYKAYNFEPDHQEVMERREVESLIADRTVIYDARTNVISYNTDLSNMTWYQNYLKANDIFAKQNPDAYMTYLLDLGYMPIVFLPSCLAQPMYAKMVNVLTKISLPFVQFKSRSFNIKYFESDTFDAWVSKLDVAELLHIAPKDVRADDLARRLFNVSR